jgi:hypothetical protein
MLNNVKKKLSLKQTLITAIPVLSITSHAKSNAYFYRHLVTSVLDLGSYAKYVSALVQVALLLHFLLPGPASTVIWLVTSGLWVS